jgi:hypothetical protein
MKRRLVAAPIVAALCAVVFLGLAAAAGAYSNDFESDTAGWSNNSGTITQQPDAYANPAYANGIASATGDFHARLDRGACITEAGGGGATIRCSGPFTQWGGYGDTWNGPYQTQVDIYLDAAYADDPANVDSYGGNDCLLTSPTDAACNGTRFDYTSAINNNTGSHLRDFGFVVGTGQPGNTCTGWVVNAQMNVNRNNAFPDDSSKDPACITDTGWFTFKHDFFENGDGNLEVLMQIIDVDTSTVVADWSLVSADSSGPDHISTVGCNRYGWFSNQEIFGLPIDNAKMTGGCAAVPQIGVIAPTATTCHQYRDNETTPMPVLEQLQYTTKGTKINAVSPGVFFYYTTVSGDEGQLVDITEDNDATTAPQIPINQGQVVLYDASTCKVVKWTVTPGAEVGEATGTLPKDGDFIIGVKYNPSSLKGAPVPVPTTVEYTFGAELDDVAIDEASIDLVPKA